MTKQTLAHRQRLKCYEKNCNDSSLTEPPIHTHHYIQDALSPTINVLAASDNRYLSIGAEKGLASLWNCQSFPF